MRVTFVAKVTQVARYIWTTHKMGIQKIKLSNATFVVCSSRPSGKGTVTFATLIPRKLQSGRGKNLNMGQERQ